MNNKLCIKKEDNSIINVNELIMEIKNNFHNSKEDNKTFEEKYPNLTMEKLYNLPYILDTIINSLKYNELHPDYYEDDYGNGHYYITDYYDEETFLKEDMFIEKMFLQEYLNNSNKNIKIDYLQETREEQINRLLENKEVFQALSLITNANTKEDIILNIKKYNLDNLPLLQDNKPSQITNKDKNILKINKDFNFYKTLLKLVCPLFFSKELNNIFYTKPTYTLNRECREDGSGYTLFSSDIYKIEFFKGDREYWDECYVYIKNKKDILVCNIGKCNYNDDTNIKDIKEGVWHDFLNEFIGEIYVFDKKIKDFNEKRHIFHINNLKAYKEKYEDEQLKEVENNFFDNFIPKKENKESSKGTNNKIDIPEEVIKALNCFNIQLSELTKLTQKKVNETYRELLKKYHPDINKNLEGLEKTKQLNESKPILITYLKNKRKKNL